MSTRGSKGALLLVFLAGAALGAAFNALERAAAVGAGFKAKQLASAVFVSERDARQALNEDLAFLSLFRHDIDEASRTVTSSLFGLGGAKALYRPGRGVTLTHDRGASLRAEGPLDTPVYPVAPESLPWPMGDAPDRHALPEGVDLEAVEAAAERLFGPEHGHTRAALVLYNGRIIAERYGPGIAAETRLPGWSMAKSVTNALFGRLVQEGRIDLAAPAPVREWSGAGDPRGRITTDQLLRMSSGLAFTENYANPFADAPVMLFARTDSAAFAASKPLRAAPDTRWAYASGTTNILSRIIRDVVGEAAYPAYPREALFNPLGMRSAVMEPDASGTYVGSSFLYATARDWARFGLLFAQDGVWEHERLLPEGWVAYSRRATPAAPRGNYGAHWWLPGPRHREAASARGIALPADLFYASGFDGQRLVIAPSRGLVLLRLGNTPGIGEWDFMPFLLDVLEALPAD